MMMRKFWKKLAPKSLLWRGILLIAVPIVVLFILLSTLIVQRYYDKVTGQLTGHVVREIRVLERDNPAQFVQSLEALGYKVIVDARLAGSRYDSFIDLSGRYIHSHFETGLARDVDIISERQQLVQVGFASNGVDYVLGIRRPLLAPINPHQILVNFIAFSLFFAAISVVLLRNQVRSIQRLASAARAFGRGQDSPYSPSGALEVREAWNSFIVMRQRIERQREQRGLMLSGISHDFRTPLTRLRLAAELLDDDDARDEMLGDIREIDEMIDSFLQYAANNSTEDYKAMRLDVLISSIAEKHPKVAIASNLPPIQSRIKPQMMRRAIENLLTNAERFGSRVEIALTENDENIIITVDDDGPGIPEHQRSEAVKAFSRVDHARNQNFGAHAGLGLAIVTDVVRQHGGVVKLDTSALGGVSARIVLPKREIG